MCSFSHAIVILLMAMELVKIVLLVIILIIVMLASLVMLIVKFAQTNLLHIVQVVKMVTFQVVINVNLVVLLVQPVSHLILTAKYVQLAIILQQLYLPLATNALISAQHVLIQTLAKGADLDS